MINIGVVSYGIHCNFTNYGSALQSWALCRSIKRLAGGERYAPFLVDYCPQSHIDQHPLRPLTHLWDKDEVSRRMCELSMPAIKENYVKFEQFYSKRIGKTRGAYTKDNLNEIVEKDNIDAFVCGSDTIFCIDEFGGFDDGYYANIPCMRNGYSVTYAASFGDAHFDEQSYRTLNERLHNFKYLGIREKVMIPYIKAHTSVPCQRTIDPTLLLTSTDYDELAVPRQIEERYILLYARRFNQAMFDFADDYAKKHGCKVVDISLRATYAGQHIMRYDAGVEEFLSLVKYAEFMVTNSFHGMIFAVQYRRPFVIFSREQCDNKIDELLDLFGLQHRKLVGDNTYSEQVIDYDNVHKRIDAARIPSITFLEQSLAGYEKH